MEIPEDLLLKNLIDSIHGLKVGGDEEKEEDPKGIEMIRLMGEDGDHKPQGLSDPEEGGGGLSAMLGGGGEDGDEEEDDGKDDLFDLIKRLKG